MLEELEDEDFELIQENLGKKRRLVKNVEREKSQEEEDKALPSRLKVGKTQIKEDEEEEAEQIDTSIDKRRAMRVKDQIFADPNELIERVNIA